MPIQPTQDYKTTRFVSNFSHSLWKRNKHQSWPQPSHQESNSGMMPSKQTQKEDSTKSSAQPVYSSTAMMLKSQLNISKKIVPMLRCQLLQQQQTLFPLMACPVYLTNMQPVRVSSQKPPQPFSKQNHFQLSKLVIQP